MQNSNLISDQLCTDEVVAPPPVQSVTFDEVRPDGTALGTKSVYRTIRDPDNDNDVALEIIPSVGDSVIK